MKQAGTIFDRVRGELQLGGGAVARGRMLVHDLERQGVTFEREWKGGPGWSTRATGYRALAGRRFFFGVSAFQGLIDSVSFGFALQPELDIYQDAKQIQGIYREFLKGELGPPDEVRHDGLEVAYRSAWGAITASYDPRAGFSEMQIHWRELTGWPPRWTEDV